MNAIIPTGVMDGTAGPPRSADSYTPIKLPSEIAGRIAIIDGDQCVRASGASSDAIAAIIALESASSQTVTTVFIDSNRTDSYVEDGTITKPFKTLATAFTAIASSGISSVAIFLAPQTNYIITSNVSLLVEATIFGMQSTVTIASGVTYTVSLDYTAYDLKVVGGSPTFAGASAANRFLLINGSETGSSVSLSQGTLDIKSRSQIGGTVAVSGGTFIPTNTVFTSKVTQAGGAITMQNCNMNTNSSTGLINSTGGSCIVENTFLFNGHATASPVIINNGVATNSFVNCTFASPNATASVAPINFAGSTSYALWGQGNTHVWGALSLPSSMPGTYLIMPTSTGKPINVQTGTTYTALPTDSGKAITCTNAAAIAVTFTAGYFATGQRIEVTQGGAGQVTLAGSGITLTSSYTLKTRAQWSTVEVVFTSPVTAVVNGDRATS